MTQKLSIYYTLVLGTIFEEITVLRLTQHENRCVSSPMKFSGSSVMTLIYFI